jgi:hypothetical protein
LSWLSFKCGEISVTDLNKAESFWGKSSGALYSFDGRLFVPQRFEGVIAQPKLHALPT